MTVPFSFLLPMRKGARVPNSPLLLLAFRSTLRSRAHAGLAEGLALPQAVKVVGERLNFLVDRSKLVDRAPFLLGMPQASSRQLLSCLNRWAAEVPVCFIE